MEAPLDQRCVMRQNRFSPKSKSKLMARVSHEIANKILHFPSSSKEEYCSDLHKPVHEVNDGNMENKDSETSITGDPETAENGTEKGIKNSKSVLENNTSSTTIEKLILSLSKGNFTCSLEELSESVNLSTESIVSIANENYHIFSIHEHDITLQPKLKICQQHCGTKGCRDRESCNDLHICNDYINEICPESYCVLGHNWNTGHNQTILKKFFLNSLPFDILQKLLNYIFVSVDLPPEVCWFYNNGGCFVEKCPFLHICNKYFHYLIGKENICPQTCLLNHDILSSSCLPILAIHGIHSNEAPRDIAFHVVSKTKYSVCNPESCQTVWSHFMNGDVAIAEICYNSVVSICPQEESGCPRLHSPRHFHWQVSEDADRWINLQPKHVICLEQGYCDPNKDCVQLPPLIKSMLDPSKMKLFWIMGEYDWYADFSLMVLGNRRDSRMLLMRRLSTELIKDKDLQPSTYVWYFRDPYGKWLSYEKSYFWFKSFSERVSSANIESCFIRDPTSSITLIDVEFSYVLCFHLMLFIKQDTGDPYEVRRRPQPHYLEENIHVDWHKLLPMNSTQRISLDRKSQQYDMLVNLMNERTRRCFTVVNMELLHNVFFMKAYQIKVREMELLYGSLSAVDEKYLFHGTKPISVESICLENFDWRLHGSNRGQAYGKGTYFTTDSRLALRFSTGHPCFLFVALVAVGKTTIGSQHMEIPPINPETNLPYDSTTNHSQNVIVKYNKQEYYPSFLISLKRRN